MGKSKEKSSDRILKKLAIDITFKLVLIPAVSLIILIIVLLTVFSPLGFLKLLSEIVTGWIIIGLVISWFIWAGIVNVFAIEPRAFLGRIMGLPAATNLALTLLIILVGTTIGLSFF